METKMKVEVWSDIMCPFCYIGKRNFESALKQFKDVGNIEVIWKSFQLAPEIKTDPSTNINEFLAKHKRMPLEDAAHLNDNVTAMAAKVGLKYNFDKAVVANSFNAHRFLHLCKDKGCQNEAKEKLLAAYFTLGKNIDDINVFAQIGKEIGLDPEEVKTILKTDKYADEVRKDILEAGQLGVRGVPFFVFDRKYAISGAQPPEAFLSALTKSFEEFKGRDF